VLGGPAGTSSLTASLSSTTELIENQVNVAAINGVYWGTWSALATTVSHFPKLELHGSGHTADLTEDQVDAHRTRMHQASESLAMFIPPSVAHGSPNDMGNE
jgi:hypothetical protein